MSSNRAKAKANIQIDNDSVIVTRWLFSPGAETGWHKHKFDYIVVPGITGKLLIETQNGNDITQLNAGQSYTRLAGVEHNVVNANDFEFYFIEIELR